MNGEVKGKSKSTMAREFLENFVAGGFLVVFALLAAMMSTPMIGGIIAGLPIRYAITWSLAAIRNGKEVAEDMARGSVIGMPGNIMFSVSLFVLLLSSVEFMLSFVSAIIIGIVVIVLMKITFPR
jgi:hypothetical protein